MKLPSTFSDVPYARNDWSAQPAGDGFSVLHCCTGPDVLTPVSVVRILRNWRGIESFDEHLRRMAASTDPARREEATTALRRQLEEFARCGLLISVPDISKVLSANAAQARSPAARIARVAIVTRNRPAMLRRSLESYVASVVHFGRSTPFLVMDDSTDTACLEENRHSIETARRRFGLPIEHFTRHEAAALERELARRTGVEPDVLTFALFGDPTVDQVLGANRNRLLLRTAGERIICVDDDTVCEFRGGDFETGWAVESSPQRDAWYFPDRASALSFHQPIPVDLIGHYEPLLGAPPSAVLSRSTLHSRTLEPNSLRRLLSVDARVLYCMPGIAGDCAQSAPFTLTLNGASRARVVKTEQDYALASQTREIVRRTSRPTLTTSPTCIGYCLGLDNEILAPPFFPLYRNSDGVYGVTLGIVHPNGMHVELPQTIVHDPVETRSFNGVDVAKACYAVGLFEIVTASVRGTARLARGARPQRRLDHLGKDLQEFASGSLNAFEQAIRGQLNVNLAARADELSRFLRDFDAEPSYWAKDVRRAIDGLHAQIADPDPVIPEELRRLGDSLAARQAMQRQVGLFGRLMSEWPNLRQAATEIHREKSEAAA